MNCKVLFLPALFICFLGLSPALSAEPLYSAAWGFYIDLPEGYQFSGGDGKDRFSFRSAEGAVLDLAVYGGGTFASPAALAEDAGRRLGNRGRTSPFEYGSKRALLMELEFSGQNGWGLCLELEAKPGDRGNPLLLALAHGPVERGDLQMLHLSALDSIAPSALERRFPGPLTEFGYPRGEKKKQVLATAGIEVLMAGNDAEAAQALVEREYQVLQRAVMTPRWKEAWIRFYRAIYRDSFERLAEAAFALERFWNPTLKREGRDERNRELAEQALGWVQSFVYERDEEGSDFVNLVSAAVEGRGDCDSRALLWALILEQANIPAAIMVSRDYGHAMGLADLQGAGARFEAGGKKWLTAETTAPVALGLIGEGVSEISKWLGVLFD